MIDARPPQLDAYRREARPDRTPEPFGSGRPGDGCGSSWSSSTRPGASTTTSAGDGRRAQELGRAQGPFGPPGGQAPGRPRRGPSARVRRVRGRDPAATTARGRSSSGTTGGIARRSPRILGPSSSAGTSRWSFRGHKLRGRWTLVRMGGRRARSGSCSGRPASASAEVEVRALSPVGAAPGSRSRRCATRAPCGDASRAASRGLGAPPGVPVRKQGSCWRRSPTRPPAGADWLFEIKYDGVRVLAERAGEDGRRCVGRSGQDITGALSGDRRGAPRARVRSRSCSTGRSWPRTRAGSRASSASRRACVSPAPGTWPRAMGDVPVAAMFFDCLALEGHDLRQPAARGAEGVPRARRCRRSASRARRPRGRQGAAFLEAAAEPGSRASSPSAGRARSRRGARTRLAQDQVPAPAGVRDRRLHRPQGAGPRFGALHLGLYDGERLVYVSKVGTGFDGAELDRLWQKLQPLRRERVAVRRPARRSGAGTTGSSPGSSRGALHRVDARRRAPPPDLPRAPQRHAPRGLPPRGGGRDDWAPVEAPASCRRRRGPGASVRARRGRPARRRGGAGIPRPPDESRQGLLAGRGLHEGRSRPLLRRDRAR